jgi:ABC-type Fe3+/spermidine/putrescine transport system ATPase subunit
VRQELTILRNHADEKENAIPGEIRGTSFVGDVIEYDVELDNRETVKCKVPSYYVSEGSLPFQTGERVFVTIDPHDCNLYSEPPLGLAKELEAY